MNDENEEKKHYLQQITGVSRETISRLEIYEGLLRRWQAKINLISDGTLGNIWERHFLDSAQLIRFIRAGSTVLDIGSGAGFPGLVLAIMGVGPITLIERDQRKCVFLREAARLTNAQVTIFCLDASKANLEPFDVVTARACSSLENLLNISRPFRSDTTYCVFPKGAFYEDELTVARKSWKMTVEVHESLTSDSGTVLILRDIVYGRSNGPRI